MKVHGEDEFADRIILHFNEKNKNDFKNNSNSWPFDLSKTDRATEPTR